MNSERMQFLRAFAKNEVKLRFGDIASEMGKDGPSKNPFFGIVEGTLRKLDQRGIINPLDYPLSTTERLEEVVAQACPRASAQEIAHFICLELAGETANAVLLALTGKSTEDLFEHDQGNDEALDTAFESLELFFQEELGVSKALGQ